MNFLRIKKTCQYFIRITTKIQKAQNDLLNKEQNLKIDGKLDDDDEKDIPIVKSAIQFTPDQIK